jgi:hypothetical protein
MMKQCADNFPQNQMIQWLAAAFQLVHQFGMLKIGVHARRHVERPVFKPARLCVTLVGKHVLGKNQVINKRVWAKIRVPKKIALIRLYFAMFLLWLNIAVLKSFAIFVVKVVPVSSIAQRTCEM